MRRFPLRRLLGALLSFAIVAGAPGSDLYRAAAQSVGAGAAESGSAARAIPSLGMTTLNTPVPSLTPSISLAPSLTLSAPSIAPEAQVLPAAALIPAKLVAAAPAASIEATSALHATGFSVKPLSVQAVAAPSYAPAALTAVRSVAATPEKLAQSGAMFDGASARGPTVTPVFGGVGRAIKRGLAILTLSVGMLVTQNAAHAQVAIQAPLLPPAVGQQVGPVVDPRVAKRPPIAILNGQAAPAPQQVAPPVAQGQANPAPADTTDAAEARAVLPRPVTATASIDRQGVTVGERVHLTITLKNTSDKPVTLQNLRAGVQDALPTDLELQGKGAEAPITLAPGETKTVTYEAIPFGSGTLTLDGGLAVVKVGETAAYPEGIEIVMPKTTLEVKSVLTPDWKDKGLKDIVGVKRGDAPNWMWLAAIPLGILLLVGVKRLVDARKLYPKLDAKRLSLVTVTQTEIERLKLEAADLDAASFYARYQELLTRFMVDFAGLPQASRDARTLDRDLHKTFYDAGQVSVAARLAREAEAARFAGVEADRTERARMLERFGALVTSVAEMAGKASKPKSDSKIGVLGMLALLPGAAGLSFGSPWVLLLLIPYAAYIVWSYRGRAKTDRFAVSSSAQTPTKRTWREKLVGLPRVLRMAAIGLLVIGLARPMIGTQRTETFIPSTDTMVSIDLSGSMSGAKLQGVRDAVRAYVEEQRKGTENRVGMVTFSDNAYLDVKLTTDYDALIAHLKELETTGSTAIGKSMLTAIAHFLELNALDLDGKADPRAATVQKILRDQGLSAALAYAKPYPDLMKQILQPERVKIVVIFTDGDSNSGISPEDAAVIAAQLGIKVYGVGISEGNESFNEKTLSEVAQKTGAKFYRATDAEGMKQVLLEISRLEKSPAKIVSSVSVHDYTSLLALLAFLALGGEMLLANTRLRTLYGMALLMGLNGMPVNLNMLSTAPRAPIEMTAQVSAPTSPTAAVPQEVIDGNKFYNQGRYAEALKKYGEALERHPDVPQIYFNMADAYLRMGENAKAEAAWAKYLSLTSDPKLQSQTIFNLGNSALAAGNAEKAMELYKEALRRDANNQDAKWNLEALKQAQKDQQQQQDKQGKEGKQGKQGKDGKPQQGKNDKSGNKGDQGKPGDGKPGDGKPGDGKPGQGKPGDGKPGQGKPGDGKPGDGKPQPGDGKPTVAPDHKQGSDKLGDALGEQEGKEKSDQLKGMTRKGKGVWGFMPALPLAFIGHGVVFSSTAMLWAVGIGLPVLAVLVAWGIKKRLEAAKKLSPGTAPKTFRSWWGARRFLGKAGLALGAAALIGLAAGDPRGGLTDERVNFGGKDIMVTVDGSYSMTYAEDGRMARTQKELNEFITRLQGTDRVGLVVFAGNARTASPISIDYGNFEFKINRLDVEARGLREGSDLAGAVKFTANAFETAKKLGDRQRILIIVSDGDVPEKDIAAAIAAATVHHITVYAIGVGDPAGTKIKVPTEDGKDSVYLIDEATGNPAITRLNEAPLRQLAERTGGAYFRSDGKAGIDRILDEVSRLEKGQKGDTIKSPSPVGVYMLWPALLLLLLDLVLPGRSLLKRGKPSESKPKSDKLNGMLPLALIPLGAWPQILPFAALAAVVAGYIAADSWSGGAITRSVREKWQTFRGFVPAGVSADLIHLYDLRETDERRLKAFVQGWQEAKDPLRETLIVMASHDEALWREKLTAAYLSGAEPETMDKILTALRRTGKTRMESLKPVMERVSARSNKLAWMAHSESEARVANLNAIAANQPIAFAEVPSAPVKPAGLWTRFKRGATVATLAIMIALTGISGVGTLRFQEQQRVAAEMSTKLFYAEDLFIFSDRYVDARIPEQVLPALKRWTESPKSAGAEFDRALTILRESPDPKADNILVAIFRHSGVLPLTNNGENILLRALIERESDALWNSMDQLIANSRNDAASAQMLVKLAIIGVESGNPKTIGQVFRVLKSPNKQVQQMAGPILFNYLARDGASFFDGLSGVQAMHANDPTLQMWTASFAFRRLAMPGVTDAELAKSQGFFDAALANAARIDAIRLEIYKLTPPDQEVQAPPSLTVMLIGMADKMQGDGGAPAPLAGAARYLVTKATTNLIKDAEAKIPGLHERLIKDGVVLPDTQSQSYSREYDDYEGHGYYGRGRGYSSSSTNQNYREVYKLSHLAALQAAIDEMAKPLAENKETPNPAARELMDRADAQIEAMLSAGEKSGMLAGGSAPEVAAESLLPVLKGGDSTFSNHAFLKSLRDAGLAPAVADLSSQLAYPEALDAAALAKLHAHLVALAAKGEGWDYSGKARPMTWDERLYLARAIDAVDMVAAKNFPDAVKAAPADAEQALLAKLAVPGEESLYMVRLAAALDSNPKNAVLALKIEKLAIARLAVAPADSTLMDGVLVRTLPMLLGTPQEADSYAALEGALRGPGGAVLAPVLRKQTDIALLGLATDAEKAFPSLKEALTDGGLHDTNNSWRTEFKQRHYLALLSAVEKAAADAKKSGKLSDEQKAVLEKIKASIPRLTPLAAKAGVTTGNEPGDVSAEMVNARLSAAYSKFPGQTFTDALVKAGLGDPNLDNRTHFRATYTKAQLIALRDWLKVYKDKGTVEESNGYYDERGEGGGESGTRALNDDEKATIQAAIDATERGIKLFGNAAPAKSGLHGIGFAPFALAALPGIAPWMIFAIVGLGAAYLIYKLLASDGVQEAVEARTAIPGSVLARNRRIELAARRMASAVNGGNFRSRFIGPGGTDFAEARPYQGEDMREIDWKTSAKKDELYAKKFELERDMPLMLVIDISNSGRFSTRGVDKRTVIEDAAAVLALAAAHSNVRVGAIFISDRVEQVIPARGGSRHAMSIVDAILKAEPTGKTTDLKPALETAGKMLGSRAMVAVLSDFIATDFKDALGALAARHDVRAIRVTDPAEMSALPDVGLLPVVDAETGATRMLDTSSKAGRAESASLVSRREAAVDAAFDASRIKPISISTEGDPLETLELAFHPKAKQPFKP